MTWFEVMALISIVICVILSGKENIWAWPIGIISAIALICVYIPNNMYANICLQLIFVIQCSLGWYNWSGKTNMNISSLPSNRIFFHVIGAFLLSWAYTKINLYLNSEVKWYYTYLDGISTFIALLANWYLTKKIIQAWPLFMLYNIILSCLLAYQGVYVLSLLNICLFFISFKAYRTWKKSIITV